MYHDLIVSQSEIKLHLNTFIVNRLFGLYVHYQHALKSRAKVNAGYSTR